MAGRQHAVQPPSPSPADREGVVGFAIVNALTRLAEARVVALGAGAQSSDLRGSTFSDHAS
jgi:hypothetical protein